MPIRQLIQAGFALVSIAAVGSLVRGAQSSVTMKQLLSTQQFERLESPFPSPLRVLPVVVAETEGWNGSLDDRWHSSDAFRGGYAEEFRDGLSTYLKARGFELGTSKEALQVRVSIDRFIGKKRAQDYGGELKGTLVLRLQGKEVGRKSLVESLTYQDESSECLTFAKQFRLPEVKFPTVLFYRLSVGLYASIAEGILEATSSLNSTEPPLSSQSPPSIDQTATPESGKTGLLTIESDPDTAEIYLDSRLVATTPAKRLRLTIGNHTITLKKAGFADWVRELVVLEDSDLTLKATLEKGQP